MHLAQELLMNIQWWFKKFCKGDKTLEDEECSGQPSEVDNNQMRASSKLILYNYMRSCQRTQHQPFYGCLAFGVNGKGEKDQSVDASWADQKKLLFCNVLLFCATVNHFSIGLWHAIKSGFYTITNNNQLNGWTEKKPQSTSQRQTCTKKGSWSLFGGLLLAWSTTAFWILVKSLHRRSGEVCSANVWNTPKTAIPVASISQQKRFNCPWQCLTKHQTTNASKIERIGL